MIGERKDWRARSRDRAAAKNNASDGGSAGIKATRLDDILKTAHPTDEPPPPPTRSESRDIKKILASHRSRPRRPLNERQPNGGITSPPPMSPEQPRSPERSPAAAEPAPEPAKLKEPLPSPDEDPEVGDVLDRLRKRKERLLNNKPGCCSHDRCKPSDATNPDSGLRIHTWPCIISRIPQDPAAAEEEEEEEVVADAAPAPVTAAPPPIVNGNDSPEYPTSPAPALTLPVDPGSPPADDLEQQALESLEGIKSMIIKERDEARKERNDAREKCAAILTEYDGRRQAWQNQLNVVKIRLEHYARRHDKLRNDIIKQREQFDMERSRMKERHAKQIEGLFGDLFNKIQTDENYIGTPSGLDEVNVKLQAFMELWKGLAHDVDDLYDKEHYCLRLAEKVKSLEEQIKYQNDVISSFVKGTTARRPSTSATVELPAPNINISVKETWTREEETVRSKFTTLLSPEDGLSCEDILQQFAPIEEAFSSVNLTMPPKRATSPPSTAHRGTSPPPSPPPLDERADSPPPPIPPQRALSPPASLRALSPPVPQRTKSPVPQRAKSPIPVSVSPVRSTVKEMDRKPDLPIEVDPEAIRKRAARLPIKSAPIEVDAGVSVPVAVQPVQPFTTSNSLFEDPVPVLIDYKETTIDDPATEEPHETTIDDPATEELQKKPAEEPEKKSRKKKKKKKPVEPAPEVEPVLAPQVQAIRDASVSPSPSFRRRRASLESAKDFSVLGDPDLDDLPYLSPHVIPPKETTLDDPAALSPKPDEDEVFQQEVAAPPPAAAAPAAPPAEKKKRWKPSIPIFGSKKPKSLPPAEDPLPVEPSVISDPASHASTTGESESKTSPSEEEEEADGAPEAAAAPETSRPMKRAKSLPRFRDHSLPRNMKRALSNQQLKRGPGSEYNSDEESDSDSDIRSLIESVYMPLHLTPSRSNSRKNIDDTKSECSSFSKRAKMPASMGWLDTNKPSTSDEDSETETSESDEETDEITDEEEDEEEEEPEDIAEQEELVAELLDVSQASMDLDPPKGEEEGPDEGSQSSHYSECSPAHETDLTALQAEAEAEAAAEGDPRISLLSDIMKSMDEDSVHWLRDDDKPPGPPPPIPPRGEILI